MKSLTRLLKRYSSQPFASNKGPPYPLSPLIGLTEHESNLYLSTRDLLEAFFMDKTKDEAKLDDFAKVFGKNKFGGLYTTKRNGGLGLTRLETSIVIEAISVGNVSISSFLAIHNMVCYLIERFGTKKQVEKYTPKLTNLKFKAAYSLTEKEAGSDSSNLNTTAIKHQNKYILNGTKTWVAGGESADVILVFARTGEKGSKKITAFLVDKNTKGLNIKEIVSTVCWKSQNIANITFTDCIIDEENVLGKEHEGFMIAMHGLMGTRINISASSLGAAQGAMEETMKHVKNRTQFAKRLLDFQNMQFGLAEMASLLHCSRLMVRQSAKLVDEESQNASFYSAMCKSKVNSDCFKIIDNCVQIYGASGFIEKSNIQHYYNNCRVHQITGGTSEIMKMIISRILARY